MRVCRELEKGKGERICTSWPELYGRRALGGRELRRALNLQRLAGYVQIRTRWLNRYNTMSHLSRLHQHGLARISRCDHHIAQIDMTQIDVEELMNRFQFFEGKGSDP
jgi:hypothetical protein